MGVSVIILGAGQGKRMKSSTPKVLHKISDREMIFYPIEVSFGLSSDVNVVLFHQFEKVKKAILSEFKDVRIHKQDGLKYPGTAGALRGVEFENSRVLILNGDMPLITEESLKTLICSKATLAMSIIELENPSGYGRVVIEGSKVTKIVEEKDCTEEQKSIKSVNAGVYSIDRELLYRYIPKISNRNSQKEYYLTDIVQMAVDDGEVVEPILVDEREFKGVNTKLDLAEAENIMQRRVKNSLMLQGVGMSMPNTIFISSKASFDGECQIESGVVILGKTEIKNSKIGANSIIEDSKIFESSIGPMARVRPNSIIKSSQIGNFVEVKNSTLNGVKAGHLSYLGDSFIDSGTNIGAGVITCNYDGKKKYQTRIGKNVFVGSDTQLIAPLIIEDDVIVGAGSTITKDVQSGSLALSRVAQKVVEGFFYRFFGRK